MTSAWTAVRWGSPLVVLATVTWLRRSLVCVTVTGESMMPGLRPGDLVVVRRGTIKSLRAGSVVVVREPPLDGCDATALKPPAGWPHAWVIKRLAALPGQPVPDAVRPTVGGVTVVPDQMIVILGDNSTESRDSRDWGFIPAEDVLGRVIRRLTTFRFRGAGGDHVHWVPGAGVLYFGGLPDGRPGGPGVVIRTDPGLADEPDDGARSLA